MNGGVEFNGIVGAFIFEATGVLLIIAVLISLIFYLTGRNSANNKPKRSKGFLLTAIIFLILDGMFFLFLLSSTDKTLSRDEAIAFDKGMFYVWIPFHLIGYFFVAFMIRYIQLNKMKIDKFLDKLR